MRVWHVIVVALCALVVCSSLSASQLSLDQAVEAALANNKELQSKRLEIKIVESERLKARLWSPTNPELELEAVSDVLTANSGEGTLRLGLTQEFELGGQRGHRKKIADAHVALAELELAASEQALARDVKAAFYSLLLAQQRLTFAKYVDSLAVSLRDTAAIRVRNGFLPKSEFTFLDIDAASSHNIVNKAEAELTESSTQLLWLMGGLHDSTPETVGEVTYQPLGISEDSVVALAIIFRPELKENSSRQAATIAELGLATRERIPNLRVSAFYSRERSVFVADDFIGNTGGIQGLKDADHLFGVRFSLPLPLIDKRRSEIAKFHSEVAVIAANNVSLENQIRYEARNAYRVLKSSEKSVDVLQNVQPESDSLFQMVQSAYAQGRVTVSDYLTQKERLLNTRLNLLDAQSSYVTAQRECERAVGLDWNKILQGE
ncbi:MAG: TolC family protein [Candidatus Zixiibacteriota bacterium]